MADIRNLSKKEKKEKREEDKNHTEMKKGLPAGSPFMMRDPLQINKNGEYLKISSWYLCLRLRNRNIRFPDRSGLRR